MHQSAQTPGSEPDHRCKHHKVSSHAAITCRILHIASGPMRCAPRCARSQQFNISTASRPQLAECSLQLAQGPRSSFIFVASRVCSPQQTLVLLPIRCAIYSIWLPTSSAFRSCATQKSSSDPNHHTKNLATSVIVEIKTLNHQQLRQLPHLPGLRHILMPG